MAVHNFPLEIMKMNFDQWARPLTFTQASGGSYSARGIVNNYPLDVPTEGDVIYSEEHTIIDILDYEFAVVPGQYDRVYIPADAGMPDLGLFEITDTDPYGGGVTTLKIRKYESAKP